MESTSTIDSLIESLIELKKLHSGDTEVVVMQYNGGNDEPCYVNPVHEKRYPDDFGRVVLQTFFV